MDLIKICLATSQRHTTADRHCTSNPACTRSYFAAQASFRIPGSFRAMSELFAGTGLAADTSARDSYMADSVRWHLQRGGPGARIVLAAHNAHIQKEPVSFDGHLTGFPMGHYLHRAMGDDYFALGLTSTEGHTADMRPDEHAPFGFTVESTPLQRPEQGSIEAAFTDADLGPGLVDLRRARREVTGDTGPDRTRLQSAYLHVPVLEAFDAVLNTATSTVVDAVR